MAVSAGGPKLTGLRKVAVLLLPWVFLAVFIFMFTTFFWPHLSSGHLVYACLGIFLGMLFISFSAAAVTFSRDVLADRYP